ncbi:MAG TPA: hypothetical protein VM818_07830 [Vicinamibacterales bacterium]|nr:hypothetical protein [Vicinamibacterales bacterium]
METSPGGRALFGAFGLLVLGGALRVVRRSPWLTWLAVVLAVAVVALSAVHAIAPHPALPVAIAAVESAFYFYATGSLIAYMLQDWVATTDELFAAGATFTLLAWAFAYAYAACEAIFPGSFSAPVNPRAAAHLDGASLSQCRRALERGAERHPAGDGDGARARYAGVVRWRDVHRARRFATDQPHHARTRSDAATATCSSVTFAPAAKKFSTQPVFSY